MTAPEETARAAVRTAIVTCQLCPRLRAYGENVAVVKKRAHRLDTYWGRPVPGFGDVNARMLIVGLAPAAHGANRTGRVFTGDGSGDFLMHALHANGFANIPTAQHASDGLTLNDAYILTVVRCAPPDNKPTPGEIAQCRIHLEAESNLLHQVRVVVALGRIAWDGYLAFARGCGTTTARHSFGHAAMISLGDHQPTLLGSYHPSRQNTNTGKLTPSMLNAVFAEARRHL